MFMADKLQSDTASKAPVKLQHASKMVLIFFVYISIIAKLSRHFTLVFLRVLISSSRFVGESNQVFICLELTVHKTSVTF